MLWAKIVVASIPAAAIGIPFDDFIDSHLSTPTVIGITLLLYGIIFIVLERIYRGRSFAIKKTSEIDIKTAFLIGIFQVLSVIPGTSRSGSTIIGGILVGASRTVAAEFTFFLAIPVMFGASLLKLLKFGFVFTAGELTILAVGCLVAFVVSILAIKFLMSYIKKHDFKAFGVYRIILGVLVLGYFIGKNVLG